jgi:hypothetical protein
MVPVGQNTTIDDGKYGAFGRSVVLRWVGEGQRATVRAAGVGMGYQV